MSLSENDDTSLVPGTNYTSNETPTFVGQGEPGARVSIQLFGEDGVLIPLEPQFVVIGQNGSWSFVTTSVIPDGHYTWNASAQDAAGNVTSSNSITLNIDTVDPVLTGVELSSASDSGVSDSDEITKLQNLTFNGTSESGNKVLLKLVSVSGLNPQPIEFSTTVTASSGLWSIDAINVPAGEYAWSVIATDAAGNTSTYESVKNLVIDTAITDFSVKLDAGSDSGSSNSDAITNSEALRLSGTAEAGSAIQVLSLVNKATNEPVSVAGLTATAGADGTWSLNIPALTADGVYEWDVQATDIAGNVGTLKGQFTFDKTISVEGALSSDSDTGASDSDTITKDTKPTITGTGQAGDRITLVLTGPSS
ncbi:hypothetical protein AT251_05615, partial [Enterovibrio nigricans]